MHAGCLASIKPPVAGDAKDSDRVLIGEILEAAVETAALRGDVSVKERYHGFKELWDTVNANLEEAEPLAAADLIDDASKRREADLGHDNDEDANETWLISSCSS